MNKFFSVKGMDKALNITIIVLGVLWLTSFFLDKGATEDIPTWEDETKAMFEAHQNGDVQGVSVTAAPMWQTELVGAMESSDERPLILFIYASWCPYCKQMFPIMDSICLLYTSPSPRDQRGSRMPSSA